MKKRIWAAFLTLVMVFSLLPTAVFAVDGENAGEITDENGITLKYEVVSTPRNGSFYVEGEEVDIQHSVINNGSESVTDVHVRVFSGGTIYPSLGLGEEQVGQSGSFVGPEEATAGEIDTLLQCSYTLNGTEYEVSLPIHIKTGLAVPELTELNVVRTDGGLEASFESNCAGTYAYAVLGEGDAAPTDWSSYAQYEMTQGSNSFTISDAPAQDAKLCLMAWNGKDEPSVQCAETAIPDYAYSLEEGFKALTETTQLPTAPR